MKKLLSLILITVHCTGCNEGVLDPESNKIPHPQQSAGVQQTEPNDSLRFLRVELPQRHLSALEIKTYVDSLEDYRYTYGTNMDPSDLASKLSDKIVAAINDGQAYDLNALLKRDAHHADPSITCYSFGYDCGGTHGYINYPIITWIDPDQRLRAFNISTYQWCPYTKIYQLSDELFLLIGDAKGSGACHYYVAYVIKLDSNGLNAEYPAFIDRPYLNFCNTPFKYDLNTRVLSTVPYEAKDNLHGHLNDRSMYGQFSTDSLANAQLFRLLSDEYFDKGSIHLTFQNGKFR